MVKRIRLLLDYGCYPVWLYDENDDVIDTYEALFINDAHEFSYVGFKNDADRELFLRDWALTTTELKEKLQGKYPLTDDVALAGI